MLSYELLDPCVVEDPDVTAFEDSRLAQLLVHWRGLAGDDDLPPAEAIDPTALVFILGWLMIIDPLAGGADFKYRLYGSSIAEVTCRDLTGCKVSDSFPDFAAFTSEVYRGAMQSRRPVLTRHTPHHRIVVSRWERLILPFATSDGSVGRFLVGAAVLGLRQEAKKRLPWPLRGGQD